MLQSPPLNPLQAATDAALDRFQRSIIDAYKAEYQDDPAYSIARSLCEKWVGLPADTVVMGQPDAAQAQWGRAPVQRFQPLMEPLAPLWFWHLGLARDALRMAKEQVGKK